VILLQCEHARLKFKLTNCLRPMQMPKYLTSYLSSALDRDGEPTEESSQAGSVPGKANLSP
jgi:hypothetical protein